MFFNGRFGEQLLPEHLHNINVSFTVDSMQEFFGGTAGNIAYGMALLGHSPGLRGTLGRDGGRYLQYLKNLGIDISYVGEIEQEFSPCAHITTDLDSNQITVFNAGAMKYPNHWRGQGLDPKNSLVIVSPGNVQDMIELPALLRRAQTPFIFDPGQSLPAWPGPVLAQALAGAFLLICNRYEFNLLCKLTSAGLSELRGQVEHVLITDGEKGSTLYSRDQGWHIAIPHNSPAPLDPTGAGDAYRAGLLWALSQGEELLRACGCGAALAALSVAFKGTQAYRLPPQGLDYDSIAISGIEY
jgi:adenosine kinase